MEIKYRNTESDIKNSINSLYLNSFYKISIFYSLFIILVIAITYVKEVKPSLNILYFIIVMLSIIFFRFYLVPVIKFKRNFNKQIQSNPNYLAEEKFSLKEKGFEITSKRYDEPQFFNWQSIKYTYTTAKYYLIILHNEKLILINKTNAEPQNILPNIFGIIEQNKVSKKNKISSLNSNQNEIKNNKTLYWVGLLGIIPNIGFIIGVVLSVIGIIRKDFKLIIIGIADVLFTIFFWSILKQIEYSGFVKNGFDKVHTEMTQSNLNNLVKQIEFYKTINGKYPEKLKQIEYEKSILFTNEIFETEKNVELYYKLKNEKYILKSFGPDKKINTNDDIHPTLKIDSTKIGLRKEL
jgi:hypothetical protein